MDYWNILSISIPLKLIGSIKKYDYQIFETRVYVIIKTEMA